MTEELYIDGNLMDIAQGTKITLQLNSNLLRDLTKVVSNSTYTIKLPRTVSNERVLMDVARVQNGGAWARTTHSVRYFVDGVPVIKNGLAKLLSVGEDFEISLTWGVSKRLESVVNDNMTLRDLTSAASILFAMNNAPEDYTTAMTRGYFYADYNPFHIERYDDWTYFEQVENQTIASVSVTFTTGQIMTGAIGDILTMSIVPTAGRQCAIVPFWLGSYIQMTNLVGLAESHSYCVVDSLNTVLYVGDVSTPFLTMYAPTRAAYIILNTDNAGSAVVHRFTDYNPTNDMTGAGFGGSRQGGGNNYILPSVSVRWILDQITADKGVVLNWSGAALSLIDTLVIPLVNNKALASGNGAIYYGTITPSTSLGNQTIYTYVNDNIFTAVALTSVTQLVVQNDCSVTFDVNVKYSWDASGITPNNGTFPMAALNYMEITIAPGGDMTQASTYFVGMQTSPTVLRSSDVYNGRIYMVIAGTGNIDLTTGDVVTFNLKNQTGTLNDLHISEGFVRVIADMGDEVVRGTNFPIVQNLPDIKVTDFLKFLCAITGTYPVQTGLEGVLTMVATDGFYDLNSSVDWSDKITSFLVPDEVTYSMSEWARKNWWRWKSDDKTRNNYDGSLVLTGCLDAERDVMEFPFAASDGNNVPVWSRQQRYGAKNIDTTKDSGTRTPTFQGCEPRIMIGYADAANKIQLTFDGLDMQTIINNGYGVLASSLDNATIIKVKVALSVVELMNFDETKPIYIRQFASYFALMTMDVNVGELATATLMRIVLPNEQPTPPQPEPYDFEVDYLESDGLAFINTGIRASNNVTIKMYLADFFDEANKNKGAYGGRSGGGSSEFGMMLDNSGNVVLGNGASPITLSSYTSYSPRCHVEFGGGTWKIGTATGTYTPDTYESNYNVYLFAMNNSGGALKGKCKIGACEISDGVTTLDLIPVVKQGVGYMYDRNTGTYYGNAGTSAFTWGDLPYDADIEFLQGDGATYINTGLVINYDSNVVVEHHATLAQTVTNVRQLNGSNGLGYWGITNQGRWECAGGASSTNSGTGWHYVVWHYNKGNGKGNVSLSVDGVTIRSTVNTIANSSDYDQFIFAIGGINHAAAQLFSKEKTMFYKIYHDGVLVIDFISVRIGTTGYLYDRINDQLYGNDGTGNFILGNDV